MGVFLLQGVILFASAFLAGMINSIAGGGTLLTFPTLIWLGLDAKEANATSTVALWPGLVGGLFGFRRELEKSRPLLVRLGITSLVGGAVGAWLLIRTPSETFARLVPFLIFFATILFMAQEPITRWLRLETNEDERARGWWTGAILFQFCAAIYGGYFGAGNGILMLSALGLLGISDIHRANGLKNFLGLTLNSVAVVAFFFSGLVSLPHAFVMATGAITGGYFGASVARRLGRTFVRRAVVLIGLTIGCLMLWRISR
ncbi:MAG TPA: sulfite exporter TauE/SafE family protein [Pyrinomonadaceae bacterium]|nr:sulfite exporter TauE/SafE family protein [Pyrinomonadaceae bacterium]